MAQERCTQEQAFAILRSASQNRNVKLRDIATRIVTGISGQAPPDPGRIRAVRSLPPDSDG